MQNERQQLLLDARWASKTLKKLNLTKSALPKWAFCVGETLDSENPLEYTKNVENSKTVKKKLHFRWPSDLYGMDDENEPWKFAKNSPSALRRSPKFKIGPLVQAPRKFSKFTKSWQEAPDEWEKCAKMIT